MINLTALTDTAGTGRRGLTMVFFYNELMAVLTDMRWAIVLLLLLVVADFRFGWGESNKRYHLALETHDDLHADIYRWHFSRAMRRTLNKFVDYIMILCVASALGKAVFEPVGISHDYGAWIGALVVFCCEITSITGHFLYLRGIIVEKRSLKNYLKAIAVALLKRKSPDIGGAVEDVIIKEREDNGNKV